MKKKFIVLGVLAVVLIAALLVMFAVPLMTAVDVDIGVAGDELAVETADLAVMDSEASLVIESNDILVPIEAMEYAPWVALGASLSILAVVYRRRFDRLYRSLCRNQRADDASADSVTTAGDRNKFISPVAA